MEAPALLQPAQRITLHAPMTAQLQEVRVKAGDTVKKGALLFRFISPKLVHDRMQLERQMEQLRWQVALPGERDTRREGRRVLIREQHALLSAHRALLDQQARLNVTAPFDGQVIQRLDAFSNGDWIPQTEPLLTLARPGKQEILAYGTEEEVMRLEAGAKAFFYPDDLKIEPWPCRLRSIPPAGTPYLDHPLLAARHGGPLPALEQESGKWRLEGAFFQLHLEPTEHQGQQRTLRGVVHIESRPASLAGTLFRHLRGVMIRELGI